MRELSFFSARAALAVLLCLPVMPGFAQQTEGLASFYADRFHNKPTSTGEVHDKDGFMAASKEYNFGTVLEVTNVVSGESVEVRVNDCGPHHPDRIIDLSRAAAAKIGIVKAGVAMVRLRVVTESDQGPTCHRGAWARAERAKKKKAETAAKRTGTVAKSPVANSRVVPPAPTVADPGRSKVPARKPLPVSTYPVPAVPADAAPAPAPPATTPATPPAEEDAAQPTQYDGSPEPALEPTFAPDDILFGVQVGAFGKPDNARAMVQQLVAVGFTDAWSVRVDKVHRVFTGKFYFPTQAETHKKRLREAGYRDATVRRVQ